MNKINIEIYQTKEGKTPFLSWLNSLDTKIRARVRERIARIQLGNFGDVKSLKEGIYELRLAFGPGYRVYFGKQDDMLVILLHGGDKGHQQRDIKKAKDLWLMYCNERNH